MSEYGATTEDAESLIAQLDSQGKLTSRDTKIEKFDMKTKFKKQKNMLPKDRNFRFIDCYQKHTSKSRETILLNRKKLN
jgi:hypothetical protein